MPEANDTSKSGWLKILLTSGGVIVTLLTVIGGIAVAWINTHSEQPTSTQLEMTTSTQSQADVIICLRFTGYQGDNLEYQYQLLNRGSTDATVTSIHIGVFGPNVKGGVIIPTNLDTVPGYNILVPSKKLTDIMTKYIYVGGVKERGFQYAKSWVIWTNGRSQQFTHVNNNTEWSNDPAC